MSLKEKLYEHKDEFKEIFNKSDDNTVEEEINSHLNSWVRSRIFGVSASLAFYVEQVDAIKLIDKIASDYF